MSFFSNLDHPVVKYLTVIVAAFIAGFGCFQAIVSVSGKSIMDPDRYVERDLFEELQKKATALSNKADSNVVNVSWAVKNAKRDNLPYALLSVIQRIHLEDINVDGKPFRKATFRNTYTVMAIRDVRKNEEPPVFREMYFSNHDGVTIQRSAGTEIQEDWGASSREYAVRFAMNKNDIKTVVTGSSFFYPRPIIPEDSICSGQISLRNNEWSWCYTNGDDYIDQLTIIVESEEVKLESVQNGALRGTVRDHDAQTVCRTEPREPNCTLVTTWSQVRRNECVSIKHRWSL